MKGKPLLPSLREKKRYVVYEYISEKEISNTKVFYAIINTYKELFGKIELSKANITKPNLYENISRDKKKNKIIDLSNENYNIIRINNKYLDPLRVALAYITEIENIKINIYTKGISGTIKKVKSKYIKKKILNEKL